MPATYKNLAAIAAFHGVSRAAVTGWRKHPKWPGPPLVKSKVDRFVKKWITPNRPIKAAAEDVEPNELEEDEEGANPSLDDPEGLEREILGAKDIARAELLSKRVRALKDLQIVRERERELLPRAEVHRGLAQRANVFRAALMNFRQLAPSLVGLEQSEIETVLEAEAIKILQEISRVPVAEPG